MSIKKGIKERIQNHIIHIVCPEIRNALKMSEDSFKDDVKKNIEDINNYLNDLFENGDPYKEGSIKKYYSGEDDPANIPVNTLVMVRYTGEYTEDVYFLNTRSAERESSYRGYNVAQMGREQGLYHYKQFPEAPKYLGYSDGTLFHFLGGDDFAIIENQSYKKKEIDAYNVMIDYLKRNKYPFVSEDVTEEVSEWDGSKHYKNYNIVCKEIGSMPINKLDSWIIKPKISKPEFKPYFSFVEKYTNKEVASI